MKIKKKNKKQIKKTIIRLLSVLLIIAIIGAFVYYFLTAEDEENNLTLLEKQWIEKNKATLIDIKIPNNIDIIGDSGNGVLFSFLDNFEETTELKFNRIPYSYPSVIEDEFSFAVLKNTAVLKDTDILIMEDYYVVLSTKDIDLNSISELNNTAIGVINDDKEIVRTYFDHISVLLTGYTDISSAIQNLTSGSVNYLIVPRYAYLEEITSDEKIYINYELENLSNKIVLRLGTNERLNTIISKSVDLWIKKAFTSDLEQALLNFYENNFHITDLEKNELTKKVYTYGYALSDAYNIEKGKALYGVAGSYINILSNMLNMDFNYIEYDNQKDMIKDLNNGKLDVAYINYEYENQNYLSTGSPFVEELAVVSNNYVNISDKAGLINRTIYAKNGNYLYDYLSDNFKNLKTIENYSVDIKNNSFIILDNSDYLYLKNNELTDYHLLLTDTYNGNYHFVVKSNNKTLYSILEYTLNATSYSKNRVDSINNLLTISNNKINFNQIYIIVLAIVLLPIIVIFLSIIIIKNAKKLKISRKENFLKYNDMLTNLKNRNYLNASIYEWDNTKIYPRTIIVIDLNNLKYVNDNYGHEEGNELIKKAAAILISTQLEKSDIIRSDGNEFLIYLIGYSKSQVATYIAKLTKEFEQLPYGFGAAMGYSIIDDEIKTIDDAINEATIEMRMDKERNYR